MRRLVGSCWWHRFLWGATAEALAATAQVQGPAFREAMGQLTDLSLLDVQQGTEPEQPPRYTLHSLVRLFVQGHLREQPGFAADARERWCRYFIDFAERNLRTGRFRECYWDCLADRRSLRDTLIELPNLLQVLDWVEQHHQQQTLVDLMLRLTHLLGHSLLFTERVSYGRRAAEAAHALGRYADEALLRIDALGWALTETENLSEAAHEIQTGLQIAATLLSEQALAHDMAALGYAFLARVYLEQEDMGQARHWIDQAMPLVCQPVIRRRVREVTAALERKQRQYQHATNLWLQSRSVARQYDPCGDIYDEGYCTYELGLVDLDQGELTLAESEFLALQALGQPIRGVEQILAEYGLASVAKARGNINAALAYAQAALDRLACLGVKHRSRKEIEAFLADFAADGDSVADAAPYGSVP